jgi:ArsR family transcriptional regulator, arsenate/arsenite/antimonite-responsive transcriptional repressor
MARQRAHDADGRIGLDEDFPTVNDSLVREFAQVFKLLSDETRLRILIYLAQSRELHVTDLCAKLGQGQPAVSHHLALMRVAGLIEGRRDGKHNYYHVCTDQFGDLLQRLLGSAGEVPRRIRLGSFQLIHGTR